LPEGLGLFSACQSRGQVDLGCRMRSCCAPVGPTCTAVGRRTA